MANGIETLGYGGHVSGFESAQRNALESAYADSLRQINLGKQIGRVQLAQDVLAWSNRHQGELSLATLKELLRVLELAGDGE